MTTAERCEQLSQGPRWPFVRLGRHGKKPIETGWPTISLEEAIAHVKSGNNCGRLVPPGHVVFDMDPRHFNPNIDYGQFTDLMNLTPTILTGGDGMHMAFTVPENVHVGGKFPGFPGIDILGEGRNTVAPGSIHPTTGKNYRWLPETVDLPVMPLPEWILREIARPEGSSSGTGVQISLETAREYLAQLDPLQFANNEDWINLMFAFHETTGGGDEALKIFTEWSERDPRYHDAKKKNISRWKSAAAHKPGNITVWTFIKILNDNMVDTARIEKIAADVSAGLDFEGLESAETGPPVTESKLEWLKRTYKIVNDGGVLRIYRMVRDESLHRNTWEWSRLKDFLEVCHYGHLLPLVDSGKKKANGAPIFVPMAQNWMDSRNGKQTYNGLAMRPDCNSERTPDGMLNMWKGFAVKPIPGSWAMLKNLIFETYCQWDVTSYDYILNWLARAVQRPWEPAGTALVLKGEKGVGKGTLGRAFWELFGQHGMQIGAQDKLVGRFNAHLMDCVALFADEAFYAGNRSGEGMLKALITEPSMVYERKGKDPTMGRNYLHIIMASNMDWVVPAGMDSERRFAVFEVEKGRGRKFFAELNYELDHGGREAMLYELLHRDISNFDVWQIPQNAALAAQKVHGMSPSAGWLLRAAESGWRMRAADSGTWQDFIEPYEGAYPVQEVYASFLRYCDERNIRNHNLNEISFGISLRKYMPRGFPEKVRKMKEGISASYYIFPEAENVANHIRKILGIDENT